MDDLQRVHVEYREGSDIPLAHLNFSVVKKMDGTLGPKTGRE